MPDRSYNVIINIRVNTKPLVDGVAKANKQLGALNATVGRILRTMSAFAALFIARGLVQGIGNAVRSFFQIFGWFH